MDWVRVSGLSSVVRIVLKAVRLVIKLQAGKNYDKMSSAEKAAVAGILAALQIFIELLPMPGDDNDPRTGT